ncbi:uncharacterized protein LOC110459261 isoform X2 [Mizuhopecten yessoensis]|uniref:uncharacterized protein LOC110459261 isoform X2 n=1 Tax=Mizuhopecten yessoensis TaxID=6573 RepID=UPI000B45D396|nr:uncharacterized protein LOC110459261 isoform X2 [Mizuhopecten yessoensis]
MTESKSSMDSERTAVIKSNLSEISNNLHKHVISLGRDPPPGHHETGNHGDSASDLDEIEQLCSRVTTLCTFHESLSSAQYGSGRYRRNPQILQDPHNSRLLRPAVGYSSSPEVQCMWKWIQWLERNITPQSKNEIPPDPEDIGPPSKTTSKVQKTGCIAKGIWGHNQRMLNLNMEQSREINDLNTTIKIDPRKKDVQETLKGLRIKQNTLTEEIEKLTASLSKVTREKDYWINRMSSMAGKKLRDNNPELIDLSDSNGPLKLADKFSELYDNQWTSASEHLHTTCQMSNENAIQQLSSLTKECYSSCYEKAGRQLQYLQKIVLTGTWEDDVDACDSKPDSDKASPVPQDLLPVLVKSSGSELEGTSMTDYLSECISLCWSMVVQDPPIVLHWPLDKQGSDIDRDMFNLYTKTGTKLNYEVWPALLLHTNGPLLRKGVVQPL